MPNIYQSSNISSKSVYVRVTLLQFFMHKLNSSWQRIAMQVVDVGIFISLMNCKLIDVSALSLERPLFIRTSSSPNHVKDEGSKRNPQKRVSLWGSKPNALN